MPTFRRSPPPPTPFFYLQDRGVSRDFRNDGTWCQSTRCHFPEDRNPNSYHCGNVKFDVVFFGGGGAGGFLNIHSQRIKILVDSQVTDPRRYMKGSDSLP